MLEVVSLDEAFSRAIDRVFSEVPFEERLRVTKEALAPFRLPEEVIWKAALPGAIDGLTGSPPLRFTRYGSMVLTTEWGYSPHPLPKGIWEHRSLTKPLWFPTWIRAPVPLPAPLLEGAGKALALVAEEVGVAPLPPFPENTFRIRGPLTLVGDFLLLHFEVEEVGRRKDMILVSGAGGALSLELFPWGEPLEQRERKREAWKLFEGALHKLSEGRPAFFPEEELAKLLETDELSGELAIEGLRHPKVFPFLSL